MTLSGYPWAAVDTAAAARDTARHEARAPRGAGGSGGYRGRLVGDSARRESWAPNPPKRRPIPFFGGRRTDRTETMDRIAGTAHACFVYGMYHRFNVVTNRNEIPRAVPARAPEPVEEIERMRKRWAGNRITT